MPKYDLFLQPGEIPSNKLKSILKDYFSEKDFEKLSKFGGRIQILLTAPFTDKKSQDNTIIVDEKLIAELKNDPKTADYILNNFTKKQLTKVAELLNFPVSSKASTKEIKHLILDFLMSEGRWAAISGG